MASSPLSNTDPPTIVKSPGFSKLAVPRGSPALLKCRAVALPAAQFQWTMVTTDPEDQSEIRRVVDPEDPSHP